MGMMIRVGVARVEQQNQMDERTRSLDISNDASRLIIHKLHTNLCDAATGSYRWF